MALPKAFPSSGLFWIHAAGSGVCIALSLIGYVTLLSPFLQRQAAATSLREEVETRQKKAANLESAIATGRRKLAALQQELTVGGVRLESAAQVNRRIASVTEFFSACDLHVDDVQTGGVCSGRQYDLVPIAIVGRGTYHQCVKLLHGLCSQYPDMSILRIDLTGNPVQADELGKFRLELFWYVAPGGPVKKAVSTEGGGSSLS